LSRLAARDKRVLRPATLGLFSTSVGSVERHIFHRIGDDESRQYGAARSRHQTREDGCAQGGCAAWHRGGVDGRPGEGYADMYSEDGSVVRRR
jgi:hypothetical protein